MNYICKEDFVVDSYDDDGFYEEEQMFISKGSIWRRDWSNFRCVGNIDTVRLIAEDGNWLELTIEHFNQLFEVEE